MTHRRFLTLLPVAMLAIVLLTGCSRGEAPTACVYLDVAGSTSVAQADYAEAVGQLVADAAKAGGAVRVAVGAGDPRTRSTVITQSFEGLDSLEESSRRAAAEAEVLDRVEEESDFASTGEGERPASAVAAGISSVADGTCATVTALTDGLETSAIDVYDDPITSTADRAAAIATLREQGVVPDLAGAALDMPFGGYVPQGSRLSDTRKAALEGLWHSYATAAGGRLSWGQ